MAYQTVPVFNEHVSYSQARCPQTQTGCWWGRDVAGGPQCDEDVCFI